MCLQSCTSASLENSFLLFPGGSTPPDSAESRPPAGPRILKIVNVNCDFTLETIICYFGPAGGRLSGEGGARSTPLPPGKKRISFFFTPGKELRHALSLTEFSKIVMLDLDLLVREPIDDLFEREAPSAMGRHASADFVDLEPIPHYVGINAGVMVMKPSAPDYKKMVRDISRKKKGRKSGMPEQEYLSKYYKQQWHHLDVTYNFQPHQLSFCDRQGLEDCPRLTTEYQKVRIVHFSAKIKPRDLLINPEYRRRYANVTRDMQGTYEMKYAEEVLLQQYIKGIDTGHSQPGGDPNHTKVVESQLRSATHASTRE